MPIRQGRVLNGRRPSFLVILFLITYSRREASSGERQDDHLPFPAPAAPASPGTFRWPLLPLGCSDGAPADWPLQTQPGLLHETAMSFTKRNTTQRVRESRDRMRARGMRLVQIWVPDTRAPGFAEALSRQCQALSDWEATSAGRAEMAFWDQAQAEALANLPD